MSELLRLGIVLLLTAGGYAVGGGLDDLVDRPTPETVRLITSVLGALVGYVLGGAAGRAIVRQVDTAAARLERVSAAQLVAACLGAGVAGLVGVAVLLPVLLLPYQRYTVPVVLLVVLVLAYGGARLGASRGADLGRFIGMRGRLEVATPSRGGGVKLVDSSALVDGRLVEVARAGFLEGTLVVPTFVLEEVQRLADSGDQQVRRRGRRGLDLLRVLQDEALVVVEISDEDMPRFAEVDAKLAAIARQRQAQLLTCDSGLARVAEVGGVRVLNLHALADAVRPPVLPGDQLTVRLLKAGREAGQAVGYLDDGTMVVVDDATAAIGREAAVDVTSIVTGRQGRMLFGVLRDET
ncbi:PIN/TRAM domain-containing protein [Nitriliruptor alkaliphilus]|uniref:PIN/TRAM domain-containing protein n=1 Tax=Nitriliruptor alkaliphilus TaxID=427918 RepID=UPI000697B31C|nr:PIN domain-containing protein [Nitriliruptor alkaliphilus]